MTIRPLPLALLLAAVLLSACDSDTMTGPDEPSRSTVAGTWAGSLTMADAELAVQLTLEETGSIVQGSGTVTSPFDEDEADLTFSIQGDYVHPLISLFLTFDRPPLGSLSGSVTMERDHIEGTMSGPGLGGRVVLDLERSAAP